MMLLGYTHHHCSNNLALFDQTARYGSLHRTYNNIADTSISPPRAARHVDTHYLPGSGIIGYF
jgi:hypothetical protein